MEWEVNKSNADSERRQLNRILDEIGTTMATTGNLVQGANVTLTGELEGRLVGPGDVTIAASGGGGGGTVDTVVPGTGIDVDATDPANPEVSLDAATIASLALADTATQPGDLGTAAYEDVGFFATAAQGTLANSAVQPGDNVSDLVNDAGYTTNTGTVTSVNLANSTGLTASGGPITASGSLTYTLSANLQAWHGLATSAKLDSSAVSAYGLTLIDDADATTARTTLGLGTAAVENIATFGNGVPRLQSSNIWGGAQQFSEATTTTLRLTATSTPGVLTNSTLWTNIGGTALLVYVNGTTNTVWHSGNILDIGTTAASARTAIGAEPTITAGTTGQFYRGDKTWSNELEGQMRAVIPSSVLPSLPGYLTGVFARSAAAGNNAGIAIIAGNTSTGCSVDFGDSDDSDAGRLNYSHGSNTFSLTINAVADVYQFTSTSLSPGVAGASTLGTAALPWGAGFFNADITSSGLNGLAGTSSLNITQPTVDGADTARTAVCGGATQNAGRGAFLQMHGMEYAGANGIARITAGTGANIELVTSSGGLTTHVGMSNSGAEYDTGIESPASWAANVDNLAIAATTRVLRVSGTAARNLSGIVQTGSGRRLTLCNVGTFNVVLIHDLTSTAANRFLCPGSVNFTLTPNMAIELWYDSTSQRWRVIN